MSGKPIPVASRKRYVQLLPFETDNTLITDIKLEPDDEPCPKHVKIEDEVEPCSFYNESYNVYLADIKTESRLNLDDDSMDIDEDSMDIDGDSEVFEWTDSVNSDQSSSEDEYVSFDYLPNWKTGPKFLKSLIFTEIPGMRFRLPDDAKPIDYFYMLADDIFFDMLVAQTNSYAEYLLLEKGEGSIVDWKDVTKEELKIFFGLLLHMGTIQCHKLHDYWKQHRLFGFQCFRQYMGRNRFALIMKCLHFSRSPRPQEPEPADKLYKVKGLIEYFNNKMEAIYVPQKQLSIDESLVLHHRRLMFCHRFQNMKRQYAWKLHMLTESTGVILNFALFHGAATPMEVVLQLVKNKLNKCYSLYMNSSYTSYALAKQLLDAHTYCSGVLRTKRDVPVELQEAKMKVSESIGRYADGVLIGKWRGTKEVFYISTEHGNDMVKTLDNKGERRTRPKPVAECYKYMPGKDFQEQILSYYPISIKPHGWDKQIGIHIILMMLYNSHLLYKKCTRSKISFYDYRLAVVEDILPEIIVKPTIIVPDHLPKKCPRKIPGKTMRRRCKQCWSRGERKDTLYYCRDCPGSPGLCLEPCFGEYHNKMLALCS